MNETGTTIKATHFIIRPVVGKTLRPHHPNAHAVENWAKEFLKDYAHFLRRAAKIRRSGAPCATVRGQRAVCARGARGVPAIPPDRHDVSARTTWVSFKSSHPATAGALSLGWTDEFPNFTEAYSCRLGLLGGERFAPLLLRAITHFGKRRKNHPGRKRQIFQIAMPQRA